MEAHGLTEIDQLACIADDEGRFADAERHYSVLMHNPDLLASLGWSYLLQGRYDESERVLREALRFAPTHQTALYNLGWLYGTRGDYEQALAIFRSAGTEAEAQRALAEVQQGARNQNAGFQKQSPGIRDRGIARGVSAPAPWNDERAAAPAPRAPLSGQGNQNQGGPAAVPLAADHSIRNSIGNSQGRIGPAETGTTTTMFNEIDAFANSSPTQANQPRQADPQANGLSAEGRASAVSGPRGGRTEPVNFEFPTAPRDGSAGPTIRPLSPGVGPAASRPGSGSWSTRPPSDPSWGNASLNSPVSARNMAERTGTPPGTFGAPDGNPGGASGDSAATVPMPDSLHRDRPPAQDAQTLAAQLGLGAGGPAFPLGGWSRAAAPRGAPESGRPAAPLFDQASRPTISAGRSASGNRPAASQQSAPSQAAEGSTAAQQTTGLPPWPGRSAIPAPLPTDVTPSGPNPPPDAVGSIR